MFPTNQHPSQASVGPLPGLTPESHPAQVSRPQPFPSPAADQGDTLNFTTLWCAFQRCWLRAVGLGLLGATAAVVTVLMLVPGQYTASAQLKVSSRPIKDSWEAEGDFSSFKQTQAALVKGNGVLRAVLANDEVARMRQIDSQSDPFGYFKKNLKTDFKAGPEILTVSLSGDHPEEVATLVNLICDTHVKHIRNEDEQLIRVHEKDLEGAQQQKAKELAQVRDNIRRIRDMAGVPNDPAVRTRRLDEAYNSKRNAQNNRDQLELKWKQAMGELRAQKELKNRLLRDGLAAVGVSVSPADVEDELRKDALANKMMTDYLKLDTYLETQKSKLDPGAWERYLGKSLSKHQQLQTSLQRMRADLQTRMERKLFDAELGKINKQIPILENHVAIYKSQMDLLDQRLVKLKKDIENLQNPDLALTDPAQKAELDKYREEEKQIEASQKTIQTKLANLMTRSRASRVSIMETAGVPVTRDWLRPLKYAVLAGLALFGLLASGVMLLEIRSQRVYAAGDLAQGGLGIPLVGSLPCIPLSRPKGMIPGSSAALDHDGRMAEAMDAIRTVLLRAPRHRDAAGTNGHAAGPRVIMVTSAMGGEGKTTLASHLAASLARAWRKTLLIDCDLRNPALHTQFEQPLEPGFCEGLRGEVEFEDVVNPTLIGRLWLMPAGRCDSHAVQALAQEGLASVFDRLKEEYDFLVIDTSPVLPVADPLMIGQHVDMVLFSVLRDVSRTPTIQSAVQRLHSLGIDQVGAVVIGEKSLPYGKAVSYPASV